MSVHLLVVNPNSSQSVTDGLESSIRPHIPPAVILNFYTGPRESPSSINNITDEVLSAAVCYKDLKDKGLLDQYDGFLICCCMSRKEAPRTSLLSTLTTIQCIEQSLTIRWSTCCARHFPNPLSGSSNPQSRDPSSSANGSGLSPLARDTCMSDTTRSSLSWAPNLNDLRGIYRPDWEWLS